MKHKKKIHKSDKNTLTITETPLEKVLLGLAILRQTQERVSLYNVTLITKLEYSRATAMYCKSLHEL